MGLPPSKTKQWVRISMATFVLATKIVLVLNSLSLPFPYARRATAGAVVELLALGCPRPTLGVGNMQGGHRSSHRACRGQKGARRGVGHFGETVYLLGRYICPFHFGGLGRYICGSVSKRRYICDSVLKKTVYLPISVLDGISVNKFRKKRYICILAL